LQKEHRIDVIEPASRTATVRVASVRVASVRVASVPAAHPYVRAVCAAEGVVVLADPVTDPAHPDRWWPPAMLDAGWIRRSADRFDVMHVHFGMESLPEGRLAAALDALDALGKPLVYTVHDLQNPQLDDQTGHLGDLDLLVPRAARLVTLTSTAADEVRRTWGRDALVLAHPTLLDDDADDPVDADPHPDPGLEAPLVVGVHLRDLRPNIDAEAAVRALLQALDALASAGVAATGRVLLNATTRDEALARRLEASLRGRGDCDLIVRARPDDAALLAELDRLDVALLPYGHGTHSGWLELCYDRGVTVVGPGSLAMAGQHPDGYVGVATPDDAGRAVLEAVSRGARAGSPERRRLVAARRERRLAERALVAEAHAALYREVLAEGRPR